MASRRYDAVVVGSGPNGLAAAITCAQAGWRVALYEAEPDLGGGTRSAQLTLPGFIHDVCSAVHPMAVATAFLRSLPLDRHGLEWIHPPVALAHPLDGRAAVALHHRLEQTSERLGPDGAAYLRLIGPVLNQWDAIEALSLGPLRLSPRLLQLSSFGTRALRSVRALARAWFQTEPARALWAGLGAHSAVPLTEAGSSAIALILAAAAHRAGWPIARGGSQAIANAMASYFRTLGGEVVTSHPVASLTELRDSTKVVLLDVAPRNLLKICGDLVPAGYRRAARRYRPGPGVFKVDWALRAPIPWASDICSRAGTVHLGGTLDEVTSSEDLACRQRHPEPPARPFVLLSQPSLFDPIRAPDGQHTVWGYCHVPNASTTNMAERIEAQIERFAPGFRSLVLKRTTRSPHEAEAHNANLIGGDITGGRNSLDQIIMRPLGLPAGLLYGGGYGTGMPGVYLCSASTPPGGGVHGLCGYHAARLALRHHKR